MNSHPPPPRPAYDSTDESDVEQTPPANAADVTDEEIARSVSNLVVQRAAADDNKDDDGRGRSREGYGFRPVLSRTASGVATPTGSSTLASGNDDDGARSPSSVIPDVNGLGWPGKQPFRSLFSNRHPIDENSRVGSFLPWELSTRACMQAARTYPLDRERKAPSGTTVDRRSSSILPHLLHSLVSFRPCIAR